MCLFFSLSRSSQIWASLIEDQVKTKLLSSSPTVFLSVCVCSFFCFNEWRMDICALETWHQHKWPFSHIFPTLPKCIFTSVWYLFYTHRPVLLADQSVHQQNERNLKFLFQANAVERKGMWKGAAETFRFPLFNIVVLLSVLFRQWVLSLYLWKM